MALIIKNVMIADKTLKFNLNFLLGKNKLKWNIKIDLRERQ